MGRRYRLMKFRGKDVTDIVKAIYERDRDLRQPITAGRIPPWEEIDEFDLCRYEDFVRVTLNRWYIGHD